ncbi:MAG: sulfatase-like hydrolase/transferase [Candidatus Omnitrophica bacterium]|nr:sulfatase-like hydrolase/transferase [Candidatus Omnitrophota bacterium]
MKPNIIFVLSDQQRWDTLSCYGGPSGLSPHLDGLAREGTIFEFAFTCQPVCGPARACLQTGKYATESGCFTNNRRLPPEEVTIAHLLRGAGYQAGYLGKWHLASCGPQGGPDDFQTRPVPPDRRGGYDDFWLAADVLEFTSHAYDGYMFDGQMRRRDFPSGKYRVEVLTDWAIEYLESQRKRQPFFLFLSFIEPHHQNDHGHFEGPVGSRERFVRYPVPDDLRNLKGDWETEYPDYLGCCSALDTAVGRLRQALKTLGLLSSTVFIYTSDHGCHFRTRNAEYKRSCHESSIRVPLIICGPGFQAGQKVSRLVSLIDLAPTVLTCAGVPVPESMRGRPLQEACKKVNDWPDEIFVQISESQVGRALRTERWKYSVSALDKNGVRDPGSEGYQEEFLYDLKEDPHELQNLVAEPETSEIRAKLAKRLIERMVKAGEKAPIIKAAR